MIETEVSAVRSYFNNHYGAKAVVEPLQFRKLLGAEVSEEQRNVLRHAE
jgi:hypothetical protein